MGARRNRGVETGILMEDVYTAANWVAVTTGYYIEVGAGFRATEAQVTPPPCLFARLRLLTADGKPGDEAHYFQWPFPTARFQSAEALYLWLLYEVEKAAAHISAERER